VGRPGIASGSVAAGQSWHDWYEQAAAVQGESLPAALGDREILQPLVAFMAAPADDFKALWHFGQWLNQQLSNVSLIGADVDRALSTALQTCEQRLTKLLESATAIAAPNQWQQLGDILTQPSVAQHLSMALIGRCYYAAGNYRQAVAVWRQAGLTTLPEFHLAQAEQVGLPQGLQHWLAVGQHTRIVTAWKQAGRPRDQAWLEPVAAALVAKQKWEQALRIYTWLADVGEIVTCLEAIWQLDGRGETVVRDFVRHSLRTGDWEAALVALETSAERLSQPEVLAQGLSFQLARAIATSELTPDQLNRDQRHRYERWLKECVLFQARWSDYLSVPEMGIAFERVGARTETLNFYEQYVDDDPAIADFARQRWLAIRRQQAQSYSRQGPIKRALRSRAIVQKKPRLGNLI
ncbi:MAG: hypothetical protein HC838_17255, partial [Spirulinaceae cyanobacterium RM2_2_10]|nr:hypothetical protein [Spirulinaceae cyanobacterium RM2_2_10]